MLIWKIETIKTFKTLKFKFLQARKSDVIIENKSLK